MPTTHGDAIISFNGRLFTTNDEAFNSSSMLDCLQPMMKCLCSRFHCLHQNTFIQGLTIHNILVQGMTVLSHQETFIQGLTINNILVQCMAVLAHKEAFIQGLTIDNILVQGMAVLAHTEAFIQGLTIHNILVQSLAVYTHKKANSLTNGCPCKPMMKPLPYVGPACCRIPALSTAADM